MHRIFVAVLSLALASCLPVLAQNVSTDPAKAPSGTYSVNAGHTQLLFSILHLGLTDYFGRFDKLSGTLNYDDKQPEHSAVNISIDMTSMDLPSARLTDDVKNVFGVQQYPTATFKSTAITRTGPDTGRMSGLLTIKDVTKPVTLDVTFNGGELSQIGGGYTWLPGDRHDQTQRFRPDTDDLVPLRRRRCASDHRSHVRSAGLNMPMTNTRKRYGSVAMALHWLIAVAIIVNLGVGLYMANILTDDDPGRFAFIQFHKSLGLTVLLSACSGSSGGSSTPFRRCRILWDED